jgi:hypothetical protein
LDKANRDEDVLMEGPVECRPFVVASSMGELCEALRRDTGNGEYGLGQYRLIDRLIKFAVEEEQVHARS